MTNHSDQERIAMAANWADEAANWLAHQLNCGNVRAETEDVQTSLDTLHDGLRAFAETLGAITVPYPPPSITSRPSLRIAK
jgi:hypothetical protein